MVSVSVIVPFRGDGAHRDRAWAWVQNQWRQHHPDWQLVAGEAPGGPWRKALAVQDAVNRAAGDVLVITDADVWCDSVADAVARLDDRNWAIPHDQVYRLTEAATLNVLDGHPPDGRSLAQRPYRGHAGGGIVVLPRDLLDTVPMDPRFEGWGQEDDSWGLALTTIAGQPRRGRSILWHLWHPPAERLNRIIGNPAGDALYQRYRKARNDHQRMRALLDEVRAVAAV